VGGNGNCVEEIWWRGREKGGKIAYREAS